MFDSLNYLDNLLFGLDTVHAAGGIAEGTLCYTGDILNPQRSSKYTLDYYMAMAEKLVDHGIHALGIKVLHCLACSSSYAIVATMWPWLRSWASRAFTLWASR